MPDKYIEDMQWCTLDVAEIWLEIDSPADINTSCVFKTEDGMCIYGHDCEFKNILKDKDVRELNK